MAYVCQEKYISMFIKGKVRKKKPEPGLPGLEPMDVLVFYHGNHLIKGISGSDKREKAVTSLKPQVSSLKPQAPYFQIFTCGTN